MNYTPYLGYLAGMPNSQNIKIFNAALATWTERSQFTNDYDENMLRFYDGVIGYVIYQGNISLRNKQNGYWAPQCVLDFLPKWQYQGKLFRVINKKRGRVKFHGKIASWTKNINAFDNFNHLSRSQAYTFLVAEANEFVGFDVNKYRNSIGVRHVYTEHEEEVIFPMDKQYVMDVFYGTLTDFKQHIAETAVV